MVLIELGALDGPNRMHGTSLESHGSLVLLALGHVGNARWRIWQR